MKTTAAEHEKARIAAEKKTQELRDILSRSYNKMETIEAILEPLTREASAHPDLKKSYKIVSDLLGDLHTWKIHNRT